jgi:mannose-6-phosphate isomerase-like protein (cupin superfamily)
LKGRPKIIEKDTGQRLQGTKKIDLRGKESQGKENRAQQQQLFIGYWGSTDIRAKRRELWYFPVPLIYE